MGRCRAAYHRYVGRPQRFGRRTWRQRGDVQRERDRRGIGLRQFRLRRQQPSTLASDGSWQTSSGSGSTSASGMTQWGYSASGGYGYVIAGGSVSGTWNQSGSADANYNTNTNSTLGNSGAWTRTGSASDGQNGGQHITYSGGGDYTIATAVGVATLWGDGGVTESGKDDWGYGYTTQSTLGSDGTWQPATGGGAATEIGYMLWDYSANGGYSRSPDGGGTLQGTWQAAGGTDDGYNVQSPSTLNPDGSWTTTGVASSSGAGSGSWSYTGSGGLFFVFQLRRFEQRRRFQFHPRRLRDVLAGLVVAVQRPVHPRRQRRGHDRHHGERLRQRQRQPRRYVDEYVGSSWSSSGDFAAGNGSASAVHAASNATIAENLQTQWQENYTITSLPGQATTTVGNASASSQLDRRRLLERQFQRLFRDGLHHLLGLRRGVRERRLRLQRRRPTTTTTSRVGRSNYAADGTITSQSSAVNHIWGDFFWQGQEDSWYESYGAGSSSGGSSSSSESGSTSYDLDVDFLGFNGGFETGSPFDNGWNVGVGLGRRGHERPAGSVGLQRPGLRFRTRRPRLRRRH